MMNFTGHFPYSDMAIAIIYRIYRSAKSPSGVVMLVGPAAQIGTGPALDDPQW